MALEGKLQADFSSYYEAVDKAIVKQRDWEADAAKVEKRLSTMTDGFTGRRVIQEAGLMAKAIEEAGGITTLTDSELRRAGNTALEAAAKMKLLGLEVPPGIQAVADASLNLANAQDRTGPSSERMRSSLRQVDNIFGVLGVSIMSEIKALEQMVEVSGKTAAQLGAVATAGAVTAAALGGWTLGRKIAEFLDLDKAIASGTATLMGWGNVASEQAAARADVLAQAWWNTGKVVTDLNQAIRINQEFFQKNANASIDWEARMQSARAAAMSLTDEQIRQIQTARELGASTEQLRDKFGVLPDTLKALDEQLRVTSSNEKKLADLQTQLAKVKADDSEKALKAARENEKKFSDLAAENTALQISMSGTKRDRRIADIDTEFDREVGKLNSLDANYEGYYARLHEQRSLKLEAESADFDRIGEMSRTALQQRADFEQNTLNAMLARSGEFSAAQIELQKETWFAAQEAVRNFGLEAINTLDSIATKAREDADRIDGFMKAATLNQRAASSFSTEVPDLNGVARDNTISRFHEAGDTSDAQALNRALSTLEGMVGRYASKNNTEFFQMQQDELLLAQLRNLKGSGTIPGFRDGVENFPGGLAYVHKDEMLVNMPKGTNVIPAGRAGGGGHTFNVTITANSRREGENAGAAFIAYMKSIGELLPTN